MAPSPCKDLGMCFVWPNWKPSTSILVDSRRKGLAEQLRWDISTAFQTKNWELCVHVLSA